MRIGGVVNVVGSYGMDHVFVHLFVVLVGSWKLVEFGVVVENSTALVWQVDGKRGLN